MKRARAVVKILATAVELAHKFPYCVALNPLIDVCIKPFVNWISLILTSSTTIAAAGNASLATCIAATPTATTHLPMMRTNPNDWTIDEVIQFIEGMDDTLAVHGDLFRRHKIDGKALLLLNSEMMMKYMGLKLGPALKICNLVSKITGRRK